jgi:hypothetical protein
MPKRTCRNGTGSDGTCPALGEKPEERGEEGEGVGEIGDGGQEDPEGVAEVGTGGEREREEEAGGGASAG